jgi:hypothetical protein
MEHARLVKRVYRAKLEDSRRSESPKLRWMDSVERNKLNVEDARMWVPDHAYGMW